jgi:hypothetical protein
VRYSICTASGDEVSVALAFFLGAVGAEPMLLDVCEYGFNAGPSRFGEYVLGNEESVVIGEVWAVLVVNIGEEVGEAPPEDEEANGTKDILVLPPVNVGMPEFIRLVVNVVRKEDCGGVVVLTGIGVEVGGRNAELVGMLVLPGNGALGVRRVLLLVFSEGGMVETTEVTVAFLLV